MKTMASSPITSWQRWENNRNSDRLYFLRLQNGDYSHEIKRGLLPGRKAMSKLDCVIESRDVTNTGHPAKAVVSPVVMHGCESWP